MSQLNLSVVTDEDKKHAEAEIKEKQREVKYDIRDFVVDWIVEQFREDFFYIPDYQREFVWPERHRCQFIESVILGLPIPMMFVADMEDGRLEIVDGAQRIQTLESFLSNDLSLNDLNRLPSLNGFRFADLPVSQQRKFSTKALRMVVLEDTTSPELRQEIFSRVNTGGIKARPSEVRRGAYAGPFMDFVKDLSQDKLFLKLCPISKSYQLRQEGEELVLRFFAYSERYMKFQHDVDKFLDKYVRDNQHYFDRGQLELEFHNTMRFAQLYLPYGFAKSDRARTTPRVRFEAIAVGINLALKAKPDLVPRSISWLTSSEFEKHTTTHASNSATRLRGRVEYVRDRLLEEAE